MVIEWINSLFAPDDPMDIEVQKFVNKHSEGLSVFEEEEKDLLSIIKYKNLFKKTIIIDFVNNQKNPQIDLLELQKKLHFLIDVAYSNWLNKAVKTHSIVDIIVADFSYTFAEKLNCVYQGVEIISGVNCKQELENSVDNFILDWQQLYVEYNLPQIKQEFDVSEIKRKLLFLINVAKDKLIDNVLLIQDVVTKKAVEAFKSTDAVKFLLDQISNSQDKVSLDGDKKELEKVASEFLDQAVPQLYSSASVSKVKEELDALIENHYEAGKENVQKLKESEAAKAAEQENLKADKEALRLQEIKGFNAKLEAIVSKVASASDPANIKDLPEEINQLTVERANLLSTYDNNEEGLKKVELITEAQTTAIDQLKRQNTQAFINKFIVSEPVVNFNEANQDNDLLKLLGFLEHHVAEYLAEIKTMGTAINQEEAATAIMVKYQEIKDEKISLIASQEQLLVPQIVKDILSKLIGENLIAEQLLAKIKELIIAIGDLRFGYAKLRGLNQADIKTSIKKVFVVKKYTYNQEEFYERNIEKIENEYQSLLNKENTRLTQFSEFNAKLDAEINQATRLTGNEKDVANQLKELKDSRARLTIERSTITSTHEDVSSLDSLDGLNDVIQGLEGKIASIRAAREAEINGFNANLDVAINQASGLTGKEKDISSQLQAIKDAQTKLTKERTTIINAHKHEDIGALDSLDGLNNAIQGLEGKIASIRAEKEAAINSFNANLDVAINQATRLTGKEKDVANQLKELKDSRARLTTERTKITSIHEDVSGLDNLDGLNNAIQGLEGKIASIRVAREAAINGFNANLDVAIKRATRLTGKEKDVSSQLQAIQYTQEQLTKERATIIKAHQHEDISSLMELTELNAAVASLIDRVSSVAQIMAAREAEINRFNQNLEVAINQASGLTGKEKDVANQLKELKDSRARLTTERTKITSIHEDVSGLDNLDGLNTYIQQLEAKIASITAARVAAINSFNANLDAVVSKVATASDPANIKDLPEEINQLTVERANLLSTYNNEEGLKKVELITEAQTTAIDQLKRQNTQAFINKFIISPPVVNFNEANQDNDLLQLLGSLEQHVAKVLEEIKTMGTAINQEEAATAIMVKYQEIKDGKISLISSQEGLLVSKIVEDIFNTLVNKKATTGLTTEQRLKQIKKLVKASKGYFSAYATLHGLNQADIKTSIKKVFVVKKYTYNQEEFYERNIEKIENEYQNLLDTENTRLTQFSEFNANLEAAIKRATRLTGKEKDVANQLKELKDSRARLTTERTKITSIHEDVSGLDILDGLNAAIEQLEAKIASITAARVAAINSFNANLDAVVSKVATASDPANIKDLPEEINQLTVERANLLSTYNNEEGLKKVELITEAQTTAIDQLKRQNTQAFINKFIISPPVVNFNEANQDNDLLQLLGSLEQHVAKVLEEIKTMGTAINQEEAATAIMVKYQEIKDGKISLISSQEGLLVSKIVEDIFNTLVNKKATTGLTTEQRLKQIKKLVKASKGYFSAYATLHGLNQADIKTSIKKVFVVKKYTYNQEEFYERNIEKIENEYQNLLDTENTRLTQFSEFNANLEAAIKRATRLTGNEKDVANQLKELKDSRAD